MAVLDWPAILIPSNETWALRGTSRSGGQTFDGTEQVVASPTARWAATLTVPCNTRAKVLAMRALLMGLDGRAGRVLVGPNETTRAPWYVDPLTGGRITYGRGSLDAARDPNYAVNPDTSSALDFRVQATVGLNGIALTAQRVRGGVLERGMFFSVLNRLHMVTALPNGELATPGQFGPPGNIPLQFRPWTLQSYPAGTAIEFGRPRTPMMLTTDDTGALELQLARTGVATVDLVQAP